MNELNEFFKAMAEAKAKDPVAQKTKKLEEQIKSNIKQDLGSLFAELSSLNVQKAAILEQRPELAQPETITEEVLTEVTPEPVNVDKYLTGKTFQQPEPDPVAKEFNAITNKMKFLEQAIAKIAAHGPGSGEVNFRWLDDVNRASIDKDRQLMYDPTTKKFLFVDTRVSIEAFDRSPTIPLLNTPQLLKPSSFTNSKNLTYDAATGVFTFLTQCEVTLALTVNALASASGQRVYQYAERNSGSGWVLIENSGKSYQLTNTQHTQIVNAQTISRQAGEQIRYFIYASEVGKVNLVTETLPNITGGTVYIPAIRIQYSGR